MSLLFICRVRESLRPEDLLEVFAGGGVGVPREVFWGAGGDDLAAVLAAFGTHVDDPVGRFNDMEIVLDDNHGVAAVDEFAEDFEEAVDVVGVEASGRLVEDVEGLAGAAAGEFGGEFDALSFAAGEGGGGLAEFDVAEADFLNGFEFREDGRDISEELNRFVDGHVKDLGNVFAFVFDFEGFVIVAATVAGGAGDVDVGEEVHFDFVDAVALAGFAAATLDVEAETAGFIAAEFGFGLLREELADLVEGAGVGRDIGARGAADWRLVDNDTFVEVFDAVDALMKTGDGLGAMETGEEFVRENLVDKGGFAGARDAGDDGHDAEREMDGNILKVVFAGANDDQFFVFFGLAAFFRDGDLFTPGEILASD